MRTWRRPMATVRNHLPPLRVVVTQELAALDPSAGRVAGGTLH
jgi:hypothetical protein